MFKTNDKVVLSQEQLHGAGSLLLDAEVISVNGSMATVIVKDEDVPRTVPQSVLAPASEVFGETTGRPNELGVIDAIRY